MNAAQRLAVALLLVAGCSGSSGSTTIHWTNQGDGYALRQEGNRLEVTERDGSVKRRAVLEVERQESSGTVHLWRVAALEPAQTTDVAWIFRHLPPSASLRLADGGIVAHPDRAIVEELRKCLAADPPDVNAVVLGLSKLRRFESRGDLIAEAATKEQLPATSLDVWVDAATKDEARALLVSGPDGKPPGGSQSNFLFGVFTALGNRTDLGDARADRLALACPGIAYDGYEAAVLLMLVGKSSTGAVLKAAESIDYSNSRYEVLKALAGWKGLSQEDADRVALACSEIGYDSYESAILVTLVGRASREAILKASDQIDSTSSRQAVLDALERK